MVLGINNFFDARNKNAKVADFQDLDHIDGVSVSAVSARTDLIPLISARPPDPQAPSTLMAGLNCNFSSM